ncbi:MAG TPA: TRAP transporter small permease [Hyphomicrobiaceae bacterium]|nr:TRAP transporter small permease [Hyphomicrobiaceae bacterium]
MDTLWNGLTRFSRAALYAGCTLLFIAALLVTAEVLVRKAIPDLVDFLTWPIGAEAAATRIKVWIRDTLTFSGSDEISGYLFAVGTSWSMAYVLITRGHVRIDVLYGRFSPGVRAVLDIIALVCLTVFVGALLERAFDLTVTNFVENNRSNTNLRIPFAWSQIPWLLGIALFFFTAVLAILRSLMALLRGDLATVNATAGASSQDEEIESELKGLGIQTPHGGKA